MYQSLFEPSTDGCITEPGQMGVSLSLGQIMYNHCLSLAQMGVSITV